MRLACSAEPRTTVVRTRPSWQYITKLSRGQTCHQVQTNGTLNERSETLPGSRDDRAASINDDISVADYGERRWVIHDMITHPVRPISVLYPSTSHPG